MRIKIHTFPDFSHPAAHSRRAAAEIELLLVIPILLTILLIIGAMLILGPARVLNVFRPNEMAYRDATVLTEPQLTDAAELPPTPDQWQSTVALPELPNRTHVAEADKSLTLKLGSASLPTIKLVNKAAYTSPAWMYTSWPKTSDGPLLKDWMQTYADDSKSSVESPLGLAPPGPPNHRAALNVSGVSAARAL